MFCINSFAQTSTYKSVSETRKKEIENNLLKASKEIKTLQCGFIQEKSSVLLVETAKSEGNMLYKSPSSLRWEYLKPTNFALILNNEDVYLKTDNGIVANSNKMFKQLGSLIISTINGESLTDSKNFYVEYFESESDKKVILVKLTPVPKRMKEIYSAIKIKIDSSDYLATEIIMEEKSGDITTIIFLNKKTNMNIPSESFSAN
jgi:outer membrane lipoprotein carrier protein